MITIRAYYTKLNYLKFLSHLDTVDLLRRAVYSTDSKVAWSEGFNPHMKMSFANPLPLGVSSEFEVFDITFEAIDNLDKLIEDINLYLPKEIQIKDYRILDKKIGINEEYKYSHYEFNVYSNEDLDLINLDLSKDLYQKRMKKSKNQRVEVREEISPYIKSYSQFINLGYNEFILKAILETSINKTINPNRFIKAVFEKYDLAIDIDSVFIHKKKMSDD